MRYIALACDYDGTLSEAGAVTPRTLSALERLQASGRKLLLVTGRQLGDLLQAFPQVTMADIIVAENGAVIYRPGSGEKRVLDGGHRDKLVAALQARGVSPLSIGEIILATRHPNEGVVLDTIRELGLELQLAFNKGAVMVLPPGVNKGAGLTVAAAELDISVHNIVGIGDAENDHSFMHLCECAVAVSNALPEIKADADLITQAAYGDGVVEAIDGLVSEDLAGVEPGLSRHHILLGKGDKGEEIRISPYGANVLLVGPSTSGKSRLASGFAERLVERKYQTCVIDPEGDYEALGEVALGSRRSPPNVEEVVRLLRDPGMNVVVYLLGLPLEERPYFLNRLLPELQQLRAQTGHPHWILIDEAHHFAPPGYESRLAIAGNDAGGLFLVTLAPGQMASSVLSTVDTVIGMGESAQQSLEQFAAVVGRRAPRADAPVGGKEDALIWDWRISPHARHMTLVPGPSTHRRHVRKYAEGDLGEDRSFLFRGPKGKLSLRARNVSTFVQMAQGVDGDTWAYHLRRGDYSRWFREHVKDSNLADAVALIESRDDVSPDKKRELVLSEVRERYIVT